MTYRLAAVLAAALLAGLTSAPAMAASAPLAAGDANLFQPNLERALEATNGRPQASWFNRSTRHGGTITAGAGYRNAKGLNCRKFSHEFSSGDHKQSYPGAACHQADGSWKIVE